jgi:membrane-associated PAP2 superfamily phosphatase
MSAKRGFWLGLALLAMCLALFEATRLDFSTQELLYQKATGEWLVNRDKLPLKWVFYKAPKIFLIVFGAALLGRMISKRVMGNWFIRKEAIYLGLCMALIPISVAVLKEITWMNCPYDLKDFGGKEVYHTLFHRPQSLVKIGDVGRCFPAGHASGGFALLGLYFVGRRKQWLTRSIAPGMVLGWIMGLYQMAKGAHFLSHTVTTMLLAWIVASGLAWAMRLPLKGSAANEQGESGDTP